MMNEMTPTGLPLPEEASQSDILAAQIKLWGFLGRLVNAYTMGESTSVRIETAQELLASACYVLGIDADSASGMTAVLGWDLDDRHRAGVKTIEAKIKAATQLWQAACLGAPRLENQSLADTLGSISGFAKQYHYRYFAHRITCDIDYQLCHPVPDSVLGVDYIIRYLRRILIENDFLNRLDPDACIGVLNACCPDFKAQLINLYQPVATNAIGLALIGGDIHGLGISPLQRRQIAGLLGPLTKAQAAQALHSAASGACAALGINDPATLRYTVKLADDLHPRIRAALSAGDLAGVFLTA